jgi:hypothetical protein
MSVEYKDALASKLRDLAALKKVEVILVHVRTNTVGAAIFAFYLNVLKR